MTNEANADGGIASRVLEPIEARILGCLIEKQATTPEAYPLTANAVLLACNQKNNRHPVLELEPGEIGHALRGMEGEGLVRSVHGSRAQRYEHRFAQSWSVTARQQAVLSLLLLRGPQTLAELHARSERLAAPAELEETRHALERLMQRAPALVVKLGRSSGQREDRYMHLLSGPVSMDDASVEEESAGTSKRAGLEARVDALEAEVRFLRTALEALRDG